MIPCHTSKTWHLLFDKQMLHQHWFSNFNVTFLSFCRKIHCCVQYLVNRERSLTTLGDTWSLWCWWAHIYIYLSTWAQVFPKNSFILPFINFYLSLSFMCSIVCLSSFFESCVLATTMPPFLWCFLLIQRSLQQLDLNAINLITIYFIAECHMMVF